MVGVIIGERLNRISAERKKIEPQMEIRVTPQIKDIKKGEVSLAGEKKATLDIEFSFTAAYGKDAGKIEIEGEIIYADALEHIKKIEADWAKDKKIADENLRLAIMNRILEVSYLQAIAMADQVKLPMPMQMPRFVAGKKEK